MINWQLIYIDQYETQSTYRMKVKGGWLVRHEHHDKKIPSSMVFLPDDLHSWELDLE